MITWMFSVIPFERMRELDFVLETDGILQDIIARKKSPKADQRPLLRCTPTTWREGGNSTSCLILEHGLVQSCPPPRRHLRSDDGSAE